MSLTERAARRRMWRGMEILPNLLLDKGIEAEKYLSSADYHPIESFADLLRISLLTSENIQSFPFELKDEECEHLMHELRGIVIMLRDASNRIEQLSSDIDRSTHEWYKSWRQDREKLNGSNP